MTKEERELLIKIASRVKSLLLYTGEREQARDLEYLLTEVLKP